MVKSWPPQVYIDWTHCKKMLIVSCSKIVNDSILPILTRGESQKTESVVWTSILADPKCGSTNEKNTKVKYGCEELEEKNLMNKRRRKKHISK